MRSFVRTVPRPGEFAAVADWADETTLIVRMQGALDFYSVREAKRLLLDELEGRPRQIVIDVGDSFVDSSGIGLLVHIAQRLATERGRLWLVCNRRLAELLHFHRLDRLMSIAETVDDALGSQRFAPRIGSPAPAGEALRRVA